MVAALWLGAFRVLGGKFLISCAAAARRRRGQTFPSHPGHQQQRPSVSASKKTAVEAFKYVAGLLGQGMTRHATLALLVVFCALPSVSSTLFSVFNCREFASSATSSSFFVASDLSLRCSLGGHTDPDYDATRSVALVLLFIWPVGMPIGFLLLLLRCRTVLMSQRSSTLSRSLRFFHREYRLPCYLWEVRPAFDLAQLVSSPPGGGQPPWHPAPVKPSTTCSCSWASTCAVRHAHEHAPCTAPALASTPAAVLPRTHTPQSSPFSFRFWSSAGVSP